MPHSDSSQNSVTPTFVQLPLDRDRAPSIGYAPASAPLQLAAVHATQDRTLYAVTAFVTTLHRYGQQAEITILWDAQQAAISPCNPCKASVTTDCDTCNPTETATGAGHVTFRFAPQDTTGNLLAQTQDILRTTQSQLTTTEAGNSLAGSLPNVGVYRLAAPGTPLPQQAMDLALVLSPDSAQLLYNGALFDTRTIERLADNMSRLHNSLLEASPDTGAHTLPLMDLPEQALVEANGPARTADYTAEPFHTRFETWCKLNPSAPAVTFEQTTLTYGELQDQSRRLAKLLQGSGVVPGCAVGVYLTPSVHQLTAVLAIMQIGAVYLPLDPTHPAALVQHMVEQAQPNLVLTDAQVSDQLTPLHLQCLLLEEALEQMAQLTPEPSGIEVTLDQPCYLLFTSGTTGKPKGVVAHHRNLAHYLQVAQETYRFGPSDRFCSIARYTFSISMFELLLPLASGASVQLMNRNDVLDPERFYGLLKQITVLHAGPSLLSALFRYLRSHSSTGKRLPELRHVSSGGDLVPPHVQEEMKEVFPNAELFVIYGCTEVSCMGCTFPIQRDQEVTRSFVGRPFTDVQVRVLDTNLQPVPMGAVGEICFGGEGIVPGYLNRPELTAERFIDWNGLRLYRTGDLGRFHANGNLEILGRSDFQVQLRGMRVELTGIENAIRSLNLAPQCAVALRKLDDHDHRLVAFLVQQDEPHTETFRRTLAEHLPDYMVPQHFVRLDALPLTANGKLDRRALQTLDFRPKANVQTSAANAPKSRLEKKIAKAFARALDLPEVGCDDSFFDLGGHSLSAVLMTEQLADDLGLTVGPGALFQAPTVRELAKFLEGTADTAHRPIRLTEGQAAPNLFLIAGVHLYRHLAEHLEGQYTVYAVYTGAELSLFDQHASAPPVSTLAAQYVELIRRQQAHGPYRVAGMSFGGIVVYEVAQQLRAQGEEVLFVGMLDAVLPQTGWHGRIYALRQFQRLRRREQLRLLYDRAKSRAMAKLKKQPRVAEFGQHQQSEALNHMEVMREDAYRDAAEAYVKQVRDWPSDVTLIAAGKRLDAEPLRGADCGWQRHVSRLQAHVVQAEHLQLLQEPWVQEVADIMRQALQRAETSA